MTDRSSRRRFLCIIGAGSSAFAAGCLESQPGSGNENDDNDENARHTDETDPETDDAPTKGEGETDSTSDGIVVESFFTPEEGETTDTPAVWHGDDDHLLVVTDKDANELLVFDAADGSYRDSIGQEGMDVGEFRFPNSVEIVGDIALVVERDNTRVQVLEMPTGSPIGTFGQKDLRAPYGSRTIATEDGYEVYVTDNYDPDGWADLDERIKHYRVTLSDGGVEADLINVFGDTNGEGALEIVETIHVDPVHDRLLIADEGDQAIKLYDLAGEFVEVVTTVFDDGFLDRGNDPEGIALYSTGNGGGYLLFTEQTDPSVFHVVDRESLEYRTRFSGEETANTDGIWLTQESFGPFSSGAFYADHDDRTVAAFDLEALDRELDGSE